MNRHGPILIICGVCVPAAAHPTLGGPMSHLLVTVHQQTVYLTLESPQMGTVFMQDGAGFSGPASVLNGTGYNAQFGWLANGFISLPPGAGMFVRTTSGSPWMAIYSESDFSPILGTDGSDPVWRWDGTMVHNWYATRVQGEHLLRHEVYVGDLSGMPLSGWTPGVIDLAFQHGRSPAHFPAQDLFVHHGASVPAPGAVGMMLCSVVAWRRRRSG